MTPKKNDPDPDRHKVYAAESMARGQRIKRRPGNIPADELPEIEEGSAAELLGKIESIADGAKWLAGVFKSDKFREYAPGLDGFTIEESHKPESCGRLRVVSGRFIACLEMHRRHWNRLLVCHELAHSIVSQFNPGLQDHGPEWRGVYLRLAADHVCTTVAYLLQRAFSLGDLPESRAFADGPIVPAEPRDMSLQMIDRSRRELFELSCLNATLLHERQPFAVIGDVCGHYYHLASRNPWTFETVLFRCVADARAYLVEVGALRLPAHSETL